MGIISWVKTKYYNHKLRQADKLATNRDFSRALKIYESLLGKQPLAYAHLAKMLVDNASSVSEKLDVLSRLVQLRNEVNEESSLGFNSTLESFVTSIESLAVQCFSAGNYKHAVDLIVSIKGFKSSQKYSDQVNKYKAFYSFNIANEQPLTTERLFKDAVESLKQLSYAPIAEIKELSQILQKEHKYARSIKFLSQFQDIDNWVKSNIFDHIVDIISNKDSELKNVNQFSDFCSDRQLCRESATDLYQRSIVKAQNKDYATSVLFDKFASEYLSEDNGFNFDRCWHLLEDLSKKADASEIQELMILANSLKLLPSQLSNLKRRIKEVAEATEPLKAIGICRLFPGDSKFDNVYLEKALILAKLGVELDLHELRLVIGNQTDAVSLPCVLSSFVIYIPAIEDLFVEAAIIAIKIQQSTTLLTEYWRIKNDCRFITALIDNSFEKWSEFANYIAENHRLFFGNQKFLDAFCSAICETNNLDITLDIFEKLLSVQRNVSNFYIEFILKKSSAYAFFTDIEKSLDIVNRGLSHISGNEAKSLITEKKRLISELITEKKFERAEKELHTLVELDAEAATLLAEFYYKRYENTECRDERLQWLYKILDVNEKYSLLDRFNSDLKASLSSLCNISIDIIKFGNKEKGFDIANRISGYYQNWIPLYTEIRELVKSSELSLSESILYDVETLKIITSNCPSCKEFDSVQFKTFWDSFSSKLIKKSQSQPHQKAIISLSALRNSISLYAPSSFINDKEEEIIRLVVRFKWELANDYEHDLSFGDAIKLYDEISNDKIQSYVNRAELRSLICHVKTKDIDTSTEARIYNALQFKSYQALREDLAYRFSCYLLEQTRPADAEKLLREYLPEEQSLLEICENIFVKEAEIRLNEFNQLVKKLNEGVMSVTEAIAFKESIRDFKRLISGKLSDVANEFNKYLPRVEAYILSKMFEEEVYMDILNRLLQENPNYIENDADFRNIAIASLGVVESDITDEEILKRSIAIYLTAIYSDKLFVKSLEYTSWDDKFEFTLEGSLGDSSYDDYDELPENVTFDIHEENRNVSIREVQNSLISRLESSVRKYHPELESFFNSEKVALDKLIELNLDKSYILASPQLCKTLDIARMSIEKAFEYELEQDYGNREDVIALGADYDFKGSEYSDYRLGYISLQICQTALGMIDSSINGIFTPYQIDNVRRFNRLFSDLTSAVVNAMNSDIKNGMNYKSFLDKYEKICKNMADNTLSLTCSNYVNGEVVSLLNDNKIDLRDSVAYMARIYNIAPENLRVKNNLENILRNLARRAEIDGLDADKEALYKAVFVTNNIFRKIVDEVTTQAKVSIIIDRINTKIITSKKALTDMYQLYRKNPEDARICENLVTLCEMCILEYVLKNAIEAEDVSITLNSLQNNMSATFREKAKKLAKTYSDLIDSLPRDLQLYISKRDYRSMVLNYRKTFSLMTALDHLKVLGSIDSSYT